MKHAQSDYAKVPTRFFSFRTTILPRGPRRIFRRTAFRVLGHRRKGVPPLPGKARTPKRGKPRREKPSPYSDNLPTGNVVETLRVPQFTDGTRRVRTTIPVSYCCTLPYCLSPCRRHVCHRFFPLSTMAPPRWLPLPSYYWDKTKSPCRFAQCSFCFAHRTRWLQHGDTRPAQRTHSNRKPRSDECDGRGEKRTCQPRANASVG